jgi:hypothetical protein
MWHSVFISSRRQQQQLTWQQLQQWWDQLQTLGLAEFQRAVARQGFHLAAAAHVAVAAAVVKAAASAGACRVLSAQQPRKLQVTLQQQQQQQQQQGKQPLIAQHCSVGPAASIGAAELLG